MSSETPAKESRLFVGSIAKCFQVLEALNKVDRPVGILELSLLVDLDRSAVQRITHTLRALGYLKQDPSTRALSLSSRMLEFGHTSLANNRVLEIAHPYLERLCKRTGETINLIELAGDEVVYVGRYPGKHPLTVDIHVGSRLPAFCTASGRAILSRLGEKEITEVLDRKAKRKFTVHTVTDTATLLSLIARAGYDGYAVNNQEIFLGDISLAAALVNPSGKPLAAINLAAPMPRWTLEQVHSYLVPQLISTTTSVNKALARL
ncbi:IclR family transcriptional regulator [Achromobacter xylosoxidans]|uniref:IclR family transcriptional regulator n=1 Tax=Alcaligenes xylosoxydans xylosoxydans TaxID=85698 RepID=UPI003F4D6B5D